MAILNIKRNKFQYNNKTYLPIYEDNIICISRVEYRTTKTVNYLLYYIDNNISYYTMCVLFDDECTLENYFSPIQIKIVLPYIHSENYNSVIINLLFSVNDNVKKELAINLIKLK
jgi:hypothetical protein